MANIVSKDTFFQSETQARYRPQNFLKSVYTRGGWITVSSNDSSFGLIEARETARQGFGPSFAGLPLDEVIVTKVSNTLYRARGVYRYRSSGSGQGNEPVGVRGPRLRTLVVNTRWYQKRRKEDKGDFSDEVKQLQYFKNSKGDNLGDTLGDGKFEYPSGDLDVANPDASDPRPRQYLLPMQVAHLSHTVIVDQSTYGAHRSMIGKTNNGTFKIFADQGADFFKNTVLFKGMEVNQIDYATRTGGGYRKFKVSYEFIIRESGWVEQEPYFKGEKSNDQAKKGLGRWEAVVVPIYQMVSFDRFNSSLQ